MSATNTDLEIRPPAWPIWAFAAATLVGAFLLFQVQPLIGKFILPWFGGAPAVWTTCMLFFQIALFGGYAYSHLLVSRLAPRRQAILHGFLLLAALIVLPIVPAESWKPARFQPRVAHAPHPFAPDGHDRAALFRACNDQPDDPIVVQSQLSQPQAVPPLFGFRDLGSLAAGAGELSVCL